jgi:asparagine synthase (glutamine-hydrolysing)
MAHAVEARVPFLDREVIEWALRVPPEAKIARPGEPEKRLLREAFDGWLPDALLWREKAEFGDGSGARDVLSEAIEAGISDERLRGRARRGGPAAAHQGGARLLPRVWREHLDGISPERTLSRFARA